MLLRPDNANAPGPREKTYPKVSGMTVAGEVFALFAMPTSAFAIGGRLGLGFYSSSALAGSVATTSLRGVYDLSSGEFSGINVYVFDGITGAVVGVIIPGGVRLVGEKVIHKLDRLATAGMDRFLIHASRNIRDQSAITSLSAQEVDAMLRAYGIKGRIANWWENRRGVVTLYRGQGSYTTQILSPIARENGVGASQQMVARMKAAGLTDDEIALATASLHTEPARAHATLPELVGLPIGGAGIPTSRIRRYSCQLWRYRRSVPS